MSGRPSAATIRAVQLIKKGWTAYRAAKHEGDAAMSTTKFSEAQIQSIIDKVVPLVAAPEDHEFFRGVLAVYGDSCNSSGQFVYTITKMLKTVYGITVQI
jgi:hypothetical protein